MTALDPKKLSVDFRNGVTPTEPTIPRRYTLTHSDITAELFLTIGLKYAYDKINPMRDEVLGEWVKIGEKYFFYAYLHVDGQLQSATAIRNAIFRRELPLALEAIRYGDKDFFSVHPELNNVPIIVYFYSANPYFNRIENWGTFSTYDITRSHIRGISDSFFRDKYLIYIGQRLVTVNSNKFIAVLDANTKCLPDYYGGVDLTRVKCIHSEKERDIKLEKALIKTFNLQSGVDKLRYYYNKVDLDDDGIPEIFVYLVGTSVCGTGGCSAAIFKQYRNQYELLSQFSLVNTPIIISDTKTNGFSDIIMYVSGGGIESFLAELKYTEIGYPSNPSVQPQLKPGTKVSGVAIIADDITSTPGIELH